MQDLRRLNKNVALLNYYNFFYIELLFFLGDICRSQHLDRNCGVAAPSSPPQPQGHDQDSVKHNDQITELSPWLCCALDLSERAAVVSACLSWGGGCTHTHTLLTVYMQTREFRK